MAACLKKRMSYARWRCLDANFMKAEHAYGLAWRTHVDLALVTVVTIVLLIAYSH
jgi:hypothetical protein